MIRIGIDLNGVMRDLNKQYLKYYIKDINPSFDETVIDMDKKDILNDLPFQSKTERKKYAYEDYPFEIFGCASTVTRNLQTFLNGWAYDRYWEDELSIGVFALNEEELSIQSTFHYLSKSGTRIRKVYFPEKKEEIWDEYDIVITTNDELYKSCPSGKICVIINKSDNNCDAKYKYLSLEDIMKDTDFVGKMKAELYLGKESWLKKLMRKIGF